MEIKMAMIPVISILTLVSCILALTVLIAASKFHSNVRSSQDDALANDYKFILQAYDLTHLNNSQIISIYGTRKIREKQPFAPGRYPLLQNAICDRYRLAPAYLFYALASIVLSLGQVGIALWCFYATTLKYDLKIIESIWFSRALESHMILYALCLLLFNFAHQHSQHEEGWIDDMKTLMKSDSRDRDYSQFTCHHTDKEAFLIAQIVNLVFIGLKLIAILASADVFNLGWGQHQQSKMLHNERISGISSIMSIATGKERENKGGKERSNINMSRESPVLDADEDDTFYRKKSV